MHRAFFRWLDRALDTVVHAAAWLALPLVVALFLQWPLRDWIGRYSLEVNDLGQIVFATYVSVALTAAARAHAHLAVDVVASRYGPRWRRRLRIAATCCAVLPWSAFVIWAAAGMVRGSVVGLEGFPETGNPGYFLIKIAVVVLAALIGIQSLRETVDA